MEILAGNLTEKQEEKFVESFYAYAEFDDCVEGNPYPWGVPWLYDSKIMLSGSTVEDMARNYHDEIIEEVKRCIAEQEEYKINC